MSGIFRRCSFAIFRADCLIRYTNNHHPMPQLDKIFRLMKMLLVLLRQLRGERCKILLAQTDHQKISCDHIISLATPMIMQQAVRESFGRDVRIYVVGGEVMGAMRRSNDRDFRANIANGGSAEAYVPSDEEKHLALEAVRLLGLDFGGVDILHSQEGPLLCEVNSNAHFAGMEKSTGADISGAIMRYIRSELEK